MPTNDFGTCNSAEGIFGERSESQDRLAEVTTLL